MNVKRARSFSVIEQTLPSAERLPTLIDTVTGIPPLVPLRWALDARHRLGIGQLTDRLRAVGLLYEWARNREERWVGDYENSIMPQGAFDLDQFLLSGHVLDELLLKEASQYVDLTAPRQLATPRRYNGHMAAWNVFLKWSLPGYKRGGRDLLTKAERRQERASLEEFFSDRRPGRKGRNFTALSEDETDAIEDSIGPCEGSFPRDVFAPKTRLRNWILYGLIRWSGIRRGEALKLTLDDLPERLPNGSFHHFGIDGRYQPGAEIYVRRRNDDIAESRARQPGVKRRGRSVPILEALARDLYHYRDTPLAEGGRLGATTPYFFVTQTGQPISISTMVGISRRITKYMRRRLGDEQRAPFTWHRLRHTRACDLFLDFWNKGDSGLQQFMDVFGWEDPKSINIYTDMVRHMAASQTVREYDRSLFE